jgi:hypothetical protein
MQAVESAIVAHAWCKLMCIFDILAADLLLRSDQAFNGYPVNKVFGFILQLAWWRVAAGMAKSGRAAVSLTEAILLMPDCWNRL